MGNYHFNVVQDWNWCYVMCRQAGAGSKNRPKHELDVFLAEVTPQMTLEGFLVLQGWGQGDPDLQGLSLEALASLIYSRMRMVAPSSTVGRSQAGDGEAQKTIRRLKRRIQRAS